jgi:glycosyltransferase involved in cell wall biosynthesis
MEEFGETYCQRPDETGKPTGPPVRPAGTSAPLVSICIPSFNTARFLRESVESAVRQTYPRIEVIVVDDNSTDGSRGILAAIQHPKVRIYINDRNLGLEGNWNRCLALARGEYMTLLPSDDVLYPDATAKRIAVLEHADNADLVLAFSARDIVSAGGRRLLRARFVREGRVSAGSLVRQSVRQGMNVIGEPGAVLFRTRLARQVGGFDESLPYVIDLDYWVRLLAHGDAYAFADAHCAFRLSGENLSFRLGRQRRQDYLAAIDRFMAVAHCAVSRSDRTRGILRAHLNEYLRTFVYFLVRSFYNDKPAATTGTQP